MKLLVAGLLSLSLVAGCVQSPEPSVSFLQTQDQATYPLAEFECLREAIYYEAGARSPDGQLAVANVIMNRAEDPRFPPTICKVVAEGEARGRCQFSYRCDGNSEDFGDAIKFRTATKAARLALEGEAGDVTKGAVYFHAASMPPGWFGTLKRTVALGGNIFYRG